MDTNLNYVSKSGDTYRVDDILSSKKVINREIMINELLTLIGKHYLLDSPQINKITTRYPLVIVIDNGRYVLLPGINKLNKLINNGNLKTQIIDLDKIKPIKDHV